MSLASCPVARRYHGAPVLAGCSSLGALTLKTTTDDDLSPVMEFTDDDGVKVLKDVFILDFRGGDKFVN